MKSLKELENFLNEKTSVEYKKATEFWIEGKRAWEGVETFYGGTCESRYRVVNVNSEKTLYDPLGIDEETSEPLFFQHTLFRKATTHMVSYDSATNSLFLQKGGKLAKPLLEKIK